MSAPSRTLPVALLTICALALAGTGCGSDDDTATTTTKPKGSTTTTAATSTTGGGEATTSSAPQPTHVTGARFRMTTADGSVSIEGPTSQCDDSPPDTVELIFAAGDATVTATVNGGTGNVRVALPEFEGTVSSASVDSDGRVHLEGRGGVADDSATPTTFTIDGTCP